jgi:hypothetical protein
VAWHEDLVDLIAHTLFDRLEPVMTILSDNLALLTTAVDNLGTAAAAKDQKIADLTAANDTLTTDEATAAATIADLTAKVNAFENPTPPPPPVARTEYVHVGVNPIDTTQYTDTLTVDASGQELFTFTGDVNPGDQLGVSADWVVGTPVPPAA